MMIRGILLALMAPLMVFGLSAQAPVKVDGGADADDQLLLATLSQLAVVATQACQALPAVKQYDAQRERIQARFAEKHPTFVIDFEKWTLVPKVPAKPGG